MTHQIIPAILVHDRETFLSQINAIQHATTFFQLDIADGIFVENETWHDPRVIRENNTLDYELHMMVADPLSEISEWIDDPHLKRIIVHAESVTDLCAAIDELRQYDRSVVVSLNPETSVEVLKPVRDTIDGVQFMTIHPGKQGQPFLSEVVDQITAFHKAHPDMAIAVDGHVNETTLPELVTAGVSRFGIGSGIFGKGVPAENIERFETILTQLTGDL